MQKVARQRAYDVMTSDFGPPVVAWRGAREGGTALVILLHGRGSNETDILTLADRLPWDSHTKLAVDRHPVIAVTHRVGGYPEGVPVQATLEPRAASAPSIALGTARPDQLLLGSLKFGGDPEDLTAVGVGAGLESLAGTGRSAA